MVHAYSITSARSAFMADVFSTAMEGASLSYWANVRGYTYKGDLTSDWSAVVFDYDSEITHTIDSNTIVEGIDLILDGKDIGLNANDYCTILGCIVMNDFSYGRGMDDELADYVVQVGLFGTIRYS